ncbi:MAG: hypothetical protein LBU14_03370 [Candidatus Peribacteria bacterium]|jgi:hypothetical protein|nr:hypothetical protein [Candidatus Peribacteria bacterium]
MNTQQTTTLTDKEISAKMKKAEKKMETKMREETKIKKEEYKNLSLDGKYVYWVNYAVKFIRGRGRF